MKILTTIARVLFIICIPLLALTSSITVAVNSSHFYTVRFAKYDVKQSLAEAGLTLTDTQMQDIAKGFIRYFNSGQEYIQLDVVQNGQPVPLFNEEEIIHFKDVKGLFVFNYRVNGFSLFYVLLYALMAIFWKQGKYRKYLAWNIVAGGGLTLGLMLLAGIGIMIDFDWLFYQFHLISFSNSFWSAEGNMLLLFPDGFWVDAARFCAVFTAVFAIVLGSIGWWYIRLKMNTVN
jgi:integral membrane protein (TIGR01906 family)